MKKTTSAALFLLASSVVRCRAVALDWNPSGLYLDCSWDTGGLRGWEYKGRTPHNWPCSRKQLANFSSQNNRRTIACIGDSITEGLFLPPGDSYPAQLYHFLRQQYNVVNLGVADIVAQRFTYLGGHSYWGLPHWRKVVPNLSRVDIAIVQLGTNDAKVGKWNRTAYRDDYLLMLQSLRQMHPNATVITSIPPPVNRMTFHVQPEVVNHELGPEIRAATERAGLGRRPVDMQREFAMRRWPALGGGPPGVGAGASGYAKALGERSGELLLPDELHPSRAGHAVMAEAFAALIGAMKGRSS